MKSIAIIHGPNINMLGKRETDIYGTDSLDSINIEIANEAKRLGVNTEFYQSNSEGELITYIHQGCERFDGIVLNAGAYTHYSLGIRDAIAATNIPTVEVHISHVYQRETFRHTSVIAPVCVGVIAGFGKGSYLLGLNALVRFFS